MRIFVYDVAVQVLVELLQALDFFIVRQIKLQEFWFVVLFVFDYHAPFLLIVFYVFQDAFSDSSDIVVDFVNIRQIYFLQVVPFLIPIA